MGFETVWECFTEGNNLEINSWWAREKYAYMYVHICTHCKFSLEVAMYEC